MDRDIEIVSLLVGIKAIDHYLNKGTPSIFDNYFENIAYSVEMEIGEINKRKRVKVKPVWRKNARVNTFDIANLIYEGMRKVNCDKNIIDDVVHRTGKVNRSTLEECSKRMLAMLEEITQ